MRHGDKINNLGRKKAHRKVLLQNLANELIVNKQIITTLAKAKTLRRFIEPLVTKSKVNETHQNRIVFKYLQNKKSTNELFNNISPKIADRQGGYTRVIKLGKRQGDNAELALIEFVDYNSVYTKNKDQNQDTKKTRRSRRRKSNVGVTNNDLNDSSNKNTQSVEPAKSDKSNKKQEEAKPTPSVIEKGDKSEKNK